MRKQLRAACQTGPKSHYRESLFCSLCRNTVATKSAARGEPARTQRDGNLLFDQHKLCASDQLRTTASRHTRACGAISFRPTDPCAREWASEISPLSSIIFNI